MPSISSARYGKDNVRVYKVERDEKTGTQTVFFMESVATTTLLSALVYLQICVRFRQIEWNSNLRDVDGSF